MNAKTAMNAKTVTLLLALAVCATITQAASGADCACTGVPRLIVDTDMYTDIDSGAVALAHVLADRGECELIGVISSTGGRSPAAGMIRLINAAYGRPDLPVSGSVAYVHASDTLQLLGGYNKRDAMPEFRHGCGDVSQNGQVKADEANVIDDIKIFTRRDARASGGEVA